MATVNNTIGSKHPKVVMVFEDEDSIVGVTKIISEFIQEYRAVRLNHKTEKYLREVQPPVILFNFTSIEKAVTFHAELAEKGTFKQPYFSIVLCNNKESSAAFRASIKGVFDNYFVSQPLYERYRLKMLIHRGIIFTARDEKYKGIQDEHFDEIDEELAELIDQAAGCKSTLLSSIEDGRNNINNVVAELKNTPEINPQEVAKELTEQHVQPLLASLEQDIKKSLDSMLAEMISKQQKHASQNIALQETEQEKQQAIVSFAQAQQKKQERVSNENANDDSKGNILIVEDNPIYQNMLVSVLSKENFATQTAKDGLTALNLLRQQNFDLVFMDLHMPKLDGLNTTKKIRGIENCKTLPVIALTSNKNKEIVKKWASYGLQGYIMKPSTKEQIVSVVNKAMSSNEHKQLAH